ncbi:MAG: HAMP domain-containing histidine kinase [Lawsonibacter sp.]|nr:HAMP domain-containing histidine kinase [Lawsonibacter sp.]
MRFYQKMTLSMLALLSLLFGIGGSLLISGSFRDSLEREKTAAFGDYRMAWGTLQIINSMDPYLDRKAITQTMGQLYQQNSAAWTNLRLFTGTEVLCEMGEGHAPFLLDTGEPGPGGCLFRITDGPDGRHYLTFSGAVETNGDILYLAASHDISALYSARQTQQRTYLQVFLVMCLLCAALSYTVSRVLTAPLEGLSRASRAIASGNYASRVRVRSSDEVGMVSQDFNVMADRLERQILELRQSVERQERFVGSFAHEMKTPMTSLIGYAELIRSGTLTQEEQSEAAGYLYSEGKRLESLSRKLLDLLVIRRQDMPLVEISPGELVEELVRRLDPPYRGKEIAVSCSCEEGSCFLEPDLTWSLLLNLADNAQKAMEGGGELCFRQRMLEDGCRIQVLDSGRGIPSQALDHLTEAFYRVDKARSRKQGGFGLGLALCQEIAALHNGSIRFENRPRGGACVTVELRGGRP